MTQTSGIAERRTAVLAQLEEGRALIRQCLTNVAPDDIYAGSSWGVMDAITHMVGRPIFLTLADRLLIEDQPELPVFPTPAGRLERAREQIDASIDDTVAYVQRLSENQLARTARRGDQSVAVIDLLETGAAHYLQHGRQIRDEILPAIRGAPGPIPATSQATVRAAPAAPSTPAAALPSTPADALPSTPAAARIARILGSAPR